MIIDRQLQAPQPAGGIEDVKPNAPFRQGKFDALCGIYSIVNAFAYARRAKRIPYFPHRTLFGELVVRMAEMSGSVEFITEGISYGSMDKLLKHAKSFYAERGYSFDIVKPSKLFDDQRYSNRKRDVAERQAWLGEAATRLDVAVILDVHTPWIWHWSVLGQSSTAAGRIALHDSFGMRSVAIEHVKPWRVISATME
jgi:hypothetical protein